MPKRETTKPEATPQELQAAVQSLLAAMREPAVLEAGEAPLALSDGSFRLEVQAGRLWLECWTDHRNLARRISAVRDATRTKVTLRVERFGGRESDLVIADLAAPAATHLSRTATRQQFREVFRRFLSRQFPGWMIRSISTEADLEHSLSPAYSRALLVKGDAGLAAIGSSEDATDPTGALTTGLIWLDYLRRREPKLLIRGLAVFVPEGFEKSTCLRVRWLDPDGGAWQVFVHRGHREEPVDYRDYGNVDTRLTPYRNPWMEMDAGLLDVVERVSKLPDVQPVDAGDGWLSLRVHGLEFARAGKDGLFYGLEQRRAAAPTDEQRLRELAAAIAERRRPGSDRHGLLYTRYPEAWLESQVRSHLRTIDATLVERPLYGQVPAFAAADRGVIDLLGIDCTGRLAVLELKAAEDVQLPMQALDYWIRVQWHLARGEFREAGYFPGREVRRDAPKLLLVTPALQFHPSNETVMRYLSPAIEVEQAGIGLEWQRELRVVTRFQRPCPYPPSETSKPR